MSIISWLSISISTCSLALAIAIMQGLERATYQKIQGINADLIMSAAGKQLNYPSIASILTKEWQHKIIAFSPSSTAHIIIFSPHDHDVTTVALCTGIDPLTNAEISALATTICPPFSGNLVDLVHDNKLLIGAKLAENLGVHVTDELRIAFLDEENVHDTTISLQTTCAQIGGIFKTGIDELDAATVFCSLDFFNTLFPTLGITHIGIKLAPTVQIAQEKEVCSQLSKRFSLSAYSWKELYPGLLSVLKLEKYSMIFIFMLIVLIAHINILALLFMHITNKQKDIALLQAYGIRTSTLSHVFILFTLILTGTAVCSGITIARLIVYIITYHIRIPLPDAYYVEYITAYLPYSHACAIGLLLLILGLCASWLPVYRIRTIQPAKILRTIPH